MGYIDFSILCLSYLNHTEEINRAKILYLLKCKMTLRFPPPKKKICQGKIFYY